MISGASSLSSGFCLSKARSALACCRAAPPGLFFFCGEIHPAKRGSKPRFSAGRDATLAGERFVEALAPAVSFVTAKVAAKVRSASLRFVPNCFTTVARSNRS